MTPLARAAEGGYYGIVKQLLRYNANPNPQPGIELENYPLLKAISSGHPHIAQCLLDHGPDPSSINCKDMFESALLSTMSFKSIFRLLLDRRADPNLNPKHNKNPLERALGSGNVTLAQMLLEKGARLEVPNLEYIWEPRTVLGLTAVQRIPMSPVKFFSTEA